MTYSERFSSRFFTKLLQPAGTNPVRDRATSFSLIFELLDEKVEKDFLIVDAGMNNLLRPSLYNSKHSIFPVKSGNKKIEYDIVGPICETSDIFRKSYLLSKQEKNNLIIICSVGAYGSSMSSDYNLRGLANEILVDGNKIL